MTAASAPVTGARTAGGRFWLLMAAALVIVVIIVGGSGSEGPPLDPRSVSPDGAKGVVETLERLGVQVDLDDAVPSPQATTALMLRNRLTSEDEAALRSWVRDGGVLVVADLSSDLAAGIRGASQPGGEPLLFQGVCNIGVLRDVERLEIRGSTLDASGGTSCFGDGERAFVVATELGAGTVVTVGSAQVFTNAELDEADAAVLAVSLLAPTGSDAHVTFIGPSVVEFGEEGLIDLVPTRVWNALWQLAAAFLLYALFRARRLGGVVAEPVPVRIEGSELVLKAGVLSQRAKDPTSAAALLRHDALLRARKALSAAPGVTDQVIVERIASQTGIEPGQVAATFLSPVTTESELAHIALELRVIDDELYERHPASDEKAKP